MATTTINVPAIRTGIFNATTKLGQQEASLRAIDRTINSMNGVWESEDQRVYAEQFQTTRAKIENFNQSVRESLKTMSQYVDDCVALDDQTARNLRNVSW